MKRSELTKGQHVALARGRDWARDGITEAYVLDAENLYSAYTYTSPRNTAAEFDDPRNPGQKLSYPGRATSSGGKLAVLKQNTWSHDGGWVVDLVSLQNAVGDYDACKATVDEAAARRRASAQTKARWEAANTAAYNELKADYPALDTYKVTGGYGSDRVTLPIELLREALRAATEKGFAEGYHSHDDHCVGTGECYTDALNPYAKAE